MTPSKGGRHIIYSKYPEPELLTSYFDWPRSMDDRLRDIRAAAGSVRHNSGNTFTPFISLH